MIESAQMPIDVKKVNTAHSLIKYEAPTPDADLGVKLQWNVSEANVNELAMNFINPAKNRIRKNPHVASYALNGSCRSLSEMSIEERKSRTRQIRIQAEMKIDKVLPKVSQIKLNNVEK